MNDLFKAQVDLEKYTIIYADPPWKYLDTREKAKNKGGGSIHHYRSMTVEEIQNLPVSSMAADNCLLFLWVTFPMLQEGLETISAWGFEYKTQGFTWLKTTKDGRPAFGVGHYTRSNAEVCLLGKKGKPKVIDHSVPSAVVSVRERHSKKPDIVRDRIVQLCGDVPRIELFARERTPGWDVWGNEV